MIPPQFGSNIKFNEVDVRWFLGAQQRVQEGSCLPSAMAAGFILGESACESLFFFLLAKADAPRQSCPPPPSSPQLAPSYPPCRADADGAFQGETSPYPRSLQTGCEMRKQ